MYDSIKADPELRRGARRITLGWLGSFLLILLAFVVLLDWSGATTRLDRLVHDSWVRWHQRDAPEEIVIAAIDPASLDVIGRWPWQRETQTKIFDVLARLGARAVVVDILYTEESRDPDVDRRLAHLLGQVPVSILPVLLEGGVGRSSNDTLPIPVLARAASDIGHVVLPIDSDGIVRRIQLKAGFRRPHWSSLSLAAHQALNPDFTDADIPGERLELSDPPEDVWTGDHEALIPFYGPAGSFTQVPVVDLLQGRVPRSVIDGRIVLIGLTSTGLGDVVPTPVSAQDRPLPGIEVHANVLAALDVDGLVTVAPSWTGLLVAACFLPLLLLLYSRSPPQWSLFLALGGSLLPVIVSLTLYSQQQLWFAPISVSIGIISSYLAWSRHRLAYVNRFLERERALLAPHMPERDDLDLQALIGFFETAVRHLPIDGWRFTVDGKHYSGGQSIPNAPADLVGNRWRFRRGIHSRRYNTPGRLEISIQLRDEDQANPVKRYIDSLGRVRSRERRMALGGSIEKLQRNAQTLSSELQWLRGVKIFSETIMSGSPMGFAVWNPAGEMIRGNALIERFIPVKSPRVALVDFIRVIEPETEDYALRQRVDGLILRGEGWQLAYEAGEQELVIVLSAIGDRLADRLICASVLDVTAVRSAERARAELVDYLSHDLRSPLISALYDIEAEKPIGQLESAELPGPAATQANPEDGLDSDVVRRRIVSNIRRSLSMMDDLLHVARADSLDGSGFTEVLFNAVVDNALDQMLPQATGRDIGFKLDTTDDELWLMGDAGSLERAVCNIIGNAIKYSPEGSSVRVSLRGDPETQCGVLTISDDGVGIDPAELKHLFVRFRRDARVVGKFKGIGLGLALVSRVVRQHGGEVEAFSPGKGTDIVMQLPLADLDNDVVSEQ